MKRLMICSLALVASMLGVGVLEAATKSVGGVAFTAPERWGETQPSSMMRKAQFRVPRASGDAEDGELAVFYFGPGQGGSIDDNVQRWAGQFTDASGQPATPTTTTRQVNGASVTVVRAEGTYASGLPMGSSTPKPNYAMLGAIVSGSEAPVFFKLVGPRATIDQAVPEFDALVASFAVE